MPPLSQPEVEVRFVPVEEKTTSADDMGTYRKDYIRSVTEIGVWADTGARAAAALWAKMCEAVVRAYKENTKASEEAARSPYRAASFARTGARVGAGMVRDAVEKAQEAQKMAADARDCAERLGARDCAERAEEAKRTVGEDFTQTDRVGDAVEAAQSKGDWAKLRLDMGVTLVDSFHGLNDPSACPE